MGLWTRLCDSQAVHISESPSNSVLTICCGLGGSLHGPLGCMGTTFSLFLSSKHLLLLVHHRPHCSLLYCRDSVIFIIVHLSES